MKALRNIGIIAALGGIAWYIAYQVKMSQKMIYGFKNVKFGQFKNGRLVINMSLTIENKTDLDVDLRGFDLDIYLNNVYITKVFSNIEMSVKPYRTTTIPIAFSIEPKKILGEAKNILNAAGQLRNMPLTMAGKIKVRKFGVPIPIPFKYTSPIKDWI